MRTSMFLAIFVIAGCKTPAVVDETDVVIDGDSDTDPDTDSDTDTDTDTDTTAPCTAKIKSVSPVNNAINIATETDVVVTFNAAVDASSFTLAVDGVAGTATLATDGKSATFNPTSDLEESTDYAVSMSVCGGAVDHSTFRTVDGPIDPITLEGRTYALDLSEVTWVKPALASAFTNSITAEYVLTQAISFDTTKETMNGIGAIGETSGTGDIVQSQCIDTIPYPNADFSGNPTFVAGPSVMTLNTDYGVVTMEEFTVNATFAADGSELNNIDITGNVDTRPLDKASGFDICKTSASFGEECVECGDGVTKCLPTEITADSAPWVKDLTIDPKLAVCE